MCLSQMPASLFPWASLQVTEDCVQWDRHWVLMVIGRTACDEMRPPKTRGYKAGQDWARLTVTTLGRGRGPLHEPGPWQGDEWHSQACLGLRRSYLSHLGMGRPRRSSACRELLGDTGGGTCGQELPVQDWGGGGRSRGGAGALAGPLRTCPGHREAGLQRAHDALRWSQG